MPKQSNLRKIKNRPTLTTEEIKRIAEKIGVRVEHDAEDISGIRFPTLSRDGRGEKRRGVTRRDMTRHDLPGLDGLDNSRPDGPCNAES